MRCIGIGLNPGAQVRDDGGDPFTSGLLGFQFFPGVVSGSGELLAEAVGQVGRGCRAAGIVQTQRHVLVIVLVVIDVQAEAEVFLRIVGNIEADLVTRTVGHFERFHHRLSRRCTRFRIERILECGRVIGRGIALCV